MRPGNRQAGFTLVELMISMFILSVVTTQLFMLIISQRRTYASHENTLEAQEDGRLATQMILFDIRMAGYMVPREAGLSSIDGATTASDVLCVSDSTIIDDSTITDVNEHFDRAVPTADVGAAAVSVTVSTGELDIDEDGDDDFIEGRGVIISNGDDTHCAQITSIDAGAEKITFTPRTPAGFDATLPDVRVVPAHIYQVTASGLLRNTVLLSPNIEDMQVEFGVDNDGNGLVEGAEFPIHDLAGFDVSLVRGARLSLVSRSDLEDPNFAGTGRPSAANRVAAGTPDGFRRRSFVAVAQPRNLE